MKIKGVHYVLMFSITDPLPESLYLLQLTRCICFKAVQVEACGTRFCGAPGVNLHSNGCSLPQEPWCERFWCKFRVNGLHRSLLDIAAHFFFCASCSHNVAVSCKIAPNLLWIPLMTATATNLLLIPYERLGGRWAAVKEQTWSFTTGPQEDAGTLMRY